MYCFVVVIDIVVVVITSEFRPNALHQTAVNVCAWRVKPVINQAQDHVGSAPLGSALFFRG